MAEFTLQNYTQHQVTKISFQLCGIITTLTENKRSILQNCAGFAALSANLVCAEDSLCGPLVPHHTKQMPLEEDKLGLPGRLCRLSSCLWSRS